MGKIRIEDKRLVFQRKDELTVIEPYGRDCLRCRSTKNGRISDEKWTVLEPATQDECVVSGDEKKATIVNGMVSATIEAGNPWYGGIITYYRKGKQILHTRFEGDYTNRNMHVEGDHYQVKVIFDANEGEHFYGMGQEQEDLFDRKGSTSQIIHYNTKSTLPVLYSSLGYGFFWNNPAPGRCETTRNHTMFVADSAYQADYFIYAGETPAQTMERYCDLTGYAPKFPRWAAGFWQCKLRYESQEDLLEVAREYKKRGIPIDAIVIDYFHWTEQGEWKFDPKYWPDPDAMCRELEEMGIHPVVSIWPTINPASENYSEMSESNMLVRTENGQFGTFDFYGQQTFIDPMNPETRKFVWGKAKENYYRHGIKTFWLDEAEPEFTGYDYECYRYHEGEVLEVGNKYPREYSRMFYEGQAASGQSDIVNLVRCAWAGSQRYGALVWSGDIFSTYEDFRKQICAGLHMGLAGIPWWTTDIGGFHGGVTEDPDFQELLIRWFQFGSFCPVMRLHGNRLPREQIFARDGEEREGTGADNEIWSYGEENYRIMKKFIEIREMMRDYTRSMMKEAHEKGTPVMRTLFYEFPEDQAAWDVTDSYLFGSDILVAPIVYPKAVSRMVYLPKGARWVHAGTGTEYEGGQSVEIDAPIDTLPVFLRDGKQEYLIGKI